MADEDIQVIHSGEDGAVDHHGEALSTLSRRASIIDVPRVEAARRTGKNPGDHPGINWFYAMMRGFCRRAFIQQFRTIEITGEEHTSSDAGTLTVAWHTNGLIDPICFVTTQPKMLVFGGRHDMITRPIIGFFASRVGGQPVLRQAELMRGGASAEAAARINGKTMLTLAECIAHGHATALFPEGTSHEESNMKRLRTGPMRSVIAANSIADEKGLDEPHLLPVGLHYRVSWYYRTDLWIEYGSPISLAGAIHPAEDRARLLAGEWVEPPHDTVNAIRDEVKERLTPMTPDAKSWREYCTWHVLGNLRTIANGGRNETWREEVLAARKARDDLRAGDTTLSDALPASKRIGDALDAAGIDGRSLGPRGLRRPCTHDRLAILPALILGLLALPLTLISSGLLIAGAKFLGDRTDEGLDARTTHHFLAAQLGPLLIWPLPILGFCTAAIMLGHPLLHVGGLAVILPFAFHLSNWMTIKAWDFYVDARTAHRLGRLRGSPAGDAIATDVTGVLAALK
jgi:1-acyl-sn-glycerol-3-phosphate acyltransferase